MFVKHIPQNKSQNQSLLIVLCALLFGGVAKMIPAIPLACFVTTVGALAWVFGEGAAAEEPEWVHRLSLASTGLLYLILGYCLGALAFLALLALPKLHR